MAAVPDETLMAYVDGELDVKERATLESILEQDAQTRARLEIFKRTGRDAVSAQFDSLLREPVPQYLLDAVQSAVVPPMRAPKIPTSGIGFSKRLAILMAGALPSWPTAAAFSASIAIAAGAAWSLKPTTPTSHVQAPIQNAAHVAAPTANGEFVTIKRGVIQAGGVLLRALETAQSRTPIEASSQSGEQEASVILRLSYRNPANAFCRQYVMRLPAGEGFAGIGCRDGDGSWQVLSHMPIGTIPAGTGQKTSPASGATPPEIASIVQRTGQALSDDEEKAALASHWRSQPH